MFRTASWFPALALTLAACPPPLPELDTGAEPWELGASPLPLQGSFFGERWSLFQGFARRSPDGTYLLVLSPEPIVACDDVDPAPGVLEASLDGLGAYPWGDGGTVKMYTAEGFVSTLGGGVDLGLGSGDTVDGGLVFEIDAATTLSGQISVPVCPP